ncbi:hypothetical protein [uncultured Anaerococcus sp.]|uniref:hypothetical protein n=1 Tax=uncultured Anaerococcus sp. TaxID=293428 RepID=UPI00262B3EE5|nr:hypothetical protein [uncultured Anaerococcus sp.]
MLFDTVYKKVMGIETNKYNGSLKELEVKMTIDKRGGTLSIGNGTTQFSIAIEDLYPYVEIAKKTKREYNGFKGI